MERDDLISRSALLAELSAHLSIVDMVRVGEIVEGMPPGESPLRRLLRVARVQLAHERFMRNRAEAMLGGYRDQYELEPVVHAHWVPAPDIGDCCYRCSACGKVRDGYCEEDDIRCACCGAHMDEEVSE